MSTDTHYFVATTYGWGVGEDVKAAVANMVRHVGPGSMRRFMASDKKAGYPGVRAVVAHINLPESTAYRIAQHVPSTLMDGTPVPYVKPVEHVYLTNTTGGTVPRSIDD